MKPAGTFTEPKHLKKHFIHTTPGPPLSQKSRRAVSDRLKQAKQEFQQMAQMNLVRPCKNNWSSPLHMVPKKGNKWRPCGDDRRLNARTLPDEYPAYFQDFVFIRHEKTIFSTTNLFKAYNHIRVAEEDIPKIVITIPFGFRNAARTCQRFMNEVLNGLDFLYVYIDYVTISCSMHFPGLKNFPRLSTSQTWRRIRIRIQRFKTYFNQQQPYKSNEYDFQGPK